MKLWLLSQNENNTWDTYDQTVVAADTEDEARIVHPDDNWSSPFRTWASHPKFVKVEYLGEAREGTKAGTILGSFHAG